MRLRWLWIVAISGLYLGACGPGAAVRPTVTPMAAATATQTTAPTPTLTHTPGPTATDAPTPTATPVPAWVTDFAQPILDAIADRAPDYQDDFSQASPDWQREMLNCRDEGCVISNGVLSLTTAPENGNESWAIMGIPCYLNFRAFALSVDVDTSQLTGNNSGGIGYDNEGSEFFFEIKDKGRWWYLPKPGQSWGMDSGELLYPVPKVIMFTIIVGNTQSAVYLNGTPVTLREFAPPMNRTGLTLRAWSDGKTPAIVEYDNLKIWALDDIPNLP